MHIRNFRPGDEPRVLDLYQAADAVDKAERGMLANDLYAWKTWPGVNPEADFFIAEAGGEPVGFVGLDVQAGEREMHVAFCSGVVHPTARRRGAGTGLMRSAEVRAAELMRGFPKGFRKYLNSFCRSSQQDVIALFESAGMLPARYFINMQRDLTTDLPSAPVPEGITIREYRSQDEGAAHAAFDEAFRDHWGYEPLTLEKFRHEFLQAPYFRPELWFLAWDGDQVAGFTFNTVNPEYIRRVGRQEGTVAEVGVRRPWRKRGVATALVSHSLHALRDAHMSTAVLGVDSDNPSGALSLYERVGFCEFWSNVLYRKQLE